MMTAVSVPSNPAAARRSKRRVFLVDDHPIVRQGLNRLVSLQPDLEICGEASDIVNAVELIRRKDPDLVLVDISLQGANGIELIKALRGFSKRIAILVVSMHDESLYAERALHAGAQGYITKEESSEKILTAISEILNGRIYLSDAMKSALLAQGSRFSRPRAQFSVDSLSDRELEVFELIGRGYSTRQIAEELFLSIKTIESYRSQIKNKLHLPTAIKLALHAFHWVSYEKKRSDA